MARLRSPVTLANLLLPGAGLILVGSIWAGLLVGVTFTAAANYTLAAFFVFPDEFAGWAKYAGLGITVVAYAGGQAILAQTSQLRESAAYFTLRKRVLREAQRLLQQGDCTAALGVLETLGDAAERDLLIAVRRAQILTATPDAQIAIGAWRQVQSIDLHGVYRRECEQQLRRLESA